MKERQKSLEDRRKDTKKKGKRIAKREGRKDK